MKSNSKPLGIVYFGNFRDNKHEDVKVAVMKCNMGSSTTGGSRWKPPVKNSTGQKVKPRRGDVFLRGPEEINDRKRRDALIKRFPEATAI